MAILWQNELGNQCKILNLDDSRIMGVEICNGKEKFIILNLYLPYCCDDNLDEFNYYLMKLDGLISDFNTPYRQVMGDFNAGTLNGH